MAAYSHNSDTMLQMTASAPLFFRHTFSGIYLEPGLIYRSSSSSSYAYDAASCTSCQTSSDNSWVGPELLVGYQWNFDSGLNISYALGLAKHLGGDQMDSSDNVDFNGYFRAGYNF
jgi:hypothetical protein